MRKESEQDGELKKAREAAGPVRAGKLYKMGLNTKKIAQVVGYAVEMVNGWLGLELSFIIMYDTSEICLTTTKATSRPACSTE